MSMKRNDDAVSPVIGVILMVAITVILAAVIAAFVFGLVGGVQSTKVVGVTVAQTGDGIGNITWQGGADMGSISYWNITSPRPSEQTNGTEPQVGAVNPILIDPQERVVITATFKDGTSQVIYDKQF